MSDAEDALAVAEFEIDNLRKQLAAVEDDGGKGDDDADADELAQLIADADVEAWCLGTADTEHSRFLAERIIALGWGRRVQARVTELQDRVQRLEFGRDQAREYLVQLEAERDRLLEALEWYYEDDKRNVEMGILESVDKRPAAASIGKRVGS